MDEQDAVIIGQLRAQVIRAGKRYAHLENDATEAEIVLTRTRLQQDDRVSGAQAAFRSLEREIAGLGEELEEVQALMRAFLLKFKGVVPGELVGQLKDRVDAWDLEGYMRRDEFLRLLDERLPRGS